VPRNDLSSGPALLTYGQVAEQLGVSVSKVKTLVRRGDLPAVDVGERNRRIRRADLIDYIERLPARAS
jgi:prophage regulatory protein